jgi:hypothetical protein
MISNQVSIRKIEDRGGDLVDELRTGGGGEHADVGDLAHAGIARGDREHGEALHEREHDEHLRPAQFPLADPGEPETHQQQRELRRRGEHGRPGCDQPAIAEVCTAFARAATI